MDAHFCPAASSPQAQQAEDVALAVKNLLKVQNSMADVSAQNRGTYGILPDVIVVAVAAGFGVAGLILDPTPGDMDSFPHRVFFAPMQ